MLKNIWLKNLLLCGLIAILAPVLLPLILTSEDGAITSISGNIKLYLLVFLLSYLAATLATKFRPRKKRKFKGAVFTPEDLKTLPQEEGTVKWFNLNKGFGFIVRDAGGEVFVHFRSIRGVGHRSLREGQRVRFVALTSGKGMQAEDVLVLDN